MQQCDPRLMTPLEIVSELASILASGYLRHIQVEVVDYGQGGEGGGYDGYGFEFPE